ncbi:MAG: hypothetical protein ACREKN_01690 [Longimicrobiaceae bacterium]
MENTHPPERGPASPRGAPPGEAEVRSELHLEGEDDDGVFHQTAERVRDAGRTVREAASRAYQAGVETGERVAGAAGRANRRLEEVEDTLERRTSLPGFVRHRPLAALGVAFGAGLLIGLGRDDGSRGWLMRQSASRIRKAVIGGLSAALVYEARSLVGLAPREERERASGWEE